MIHHLIFNNSYKIKYDSLNIITYDDYKSLINKMYIEQHSIIKYNNINILQIQSFYKLTQHQINYLQ